jgi:hypothetical protein
LTVIFVEPLPDTKAGLKVAVAPVGELEAEKLTWPLKPALGEMVSVYGGDVVVGSVTVCTPGDTLTEKSGLEVTVSVAVWVWAI